MINNYDDLTKEQIFPYVGNDNYKNLLTRFMNSKLCAESDEFIISEALQIYANTNDDNLKVRILEMLKNINF